MTYKLYIKDKKQLSRACNHFTNASTICQGNCVPLTLSGLCMQLCDGFRTSYWQYVNKSVSSLTMILSSKVLSCRALHENQQSPRCMEASLLPFRLSKIVAHTIGLLTQSKYTVALLSSFQGNIIVWPSLFVQSLNSPECVGNVLIILSCGIKRVCHHFQHN